MSASVGKQYSQGERIEKVLKNPYKLINFDPSVNTDVSKEEYQVLCENAVTLQDGLIVAFINYDNILDINRIFNNVSRKNRSTIISIPPAMRTQEMILRVIPFSPDAILLGNMSEYTDEFYKKAVDSDSNVIDFIPEKSQTEELLIQLVKKNSYHLSRIPTCKRTHKVCLAANSGYYSNLNNVPDEIRTHDFYLELIKLNPGVFKYISHLTITFEMCIAAIEANSSTIKDVPTRYRTKELLMKLLEKDPKNITYLTTKEKTFEVCQYVIDKDPSLAHHCNITWADAMKMQEEFKLKYDELYKSYQKLTFDGEYSECDSEFINKLVNRLSNNEILKKCTSFDLDKETVLSMITNMKLTRDTWDHIINHSNNTNVLVEVASKIDSINGPEASLSVALLNNSKTKLSVKDAFIQRNMAYLKLCIVQQISLATKLDDQNTLLHAACKNHDVEMVELLIQRVVKFDHFNIYEETPLHIICDTRNNCDDEQCEKIIDILYQYYDSNFKFVLEYRTKEGLTALHYAAANCNKKLISKLIGLGANKNAVDKNNERPIHHAVKNQNISIAVIELLY